MKNFIIGITRFSIFLILVVYCLSFFIEGKTIYEKLIFVFLSLLFTFILFEIEKQFHFLGLTNWDRQNFGRKSLYKKFRILVPLFADKIKSEKIGYKIFINEKESDYVFYYAKIFDRENDCDSDYFIYISDKINRDKIHIGITQNKKEIIREDLENKEKMILILEKSIDYAIKNFKLLTKEEIIYIYLEEENLDTIKEIEKRTKEMF